MTITQRRIFLLFFVILFVVTAPVIVLMAKGYRFDRHGRIFVYSGSVSVKSWPRQIDIYLDGEFQDKKRLNVINNFYTINGIRPGRYVLRCEKEGYTSWEKTIEVHSGVSTEFWNVTLFPKDLPQTTAFDSNSVAQFFLSPRDKDEVVLFSREENERVVYLLNTTDNSTEEIYRTAELDFVDPTEKENVEWSSDNKSILIPFNKQGEKTYVIARIRRDDLRDVINVHDLFKDYEPTTKIGGENKSSAKTIEQSNNRTIDLRFHQVRWMFDKNDELVVLTKNQELFYVDTNKPENKILLDTGVSSFDFAGNRIYYSQSPNNIIWEIRDNNIESKRQITDLPVTSEEGNFLKMIVYDQYRIALITPTGQLFVRNEEKEKGEESLGKISENVNDIQFSDDGKKLLFWTDNEIWCLVLRQWEIQPLREKGDQIFITRFSQPIANVQWMDNYENILFSIGPTLKVAELDVRDHANISDLKTFNEAVAERDLIYDKSNQLLYSRFKKDEKYQLQSSLLVDKAGFLGL